ncbi:dipeptidyl aminopeptidase/acylaminoacyl peptidase [Paenibacillus amylolyticus]|uniref:Dipeptidyl aminopeptidase/acylaminoacyl peptidase n=1 Tax=Paenibacillus amylolyticus TaxID=1451 RepID=A0AAP5H4K5_PAEAM|nr:S9 family peptidase [Paenibacillus amylolyticus]MDR6726255.1 dipeptidyl aminopeptidase/acylaminoacyl peptidase [Paenibacillus amylolyticus]
MNQRPIIPEDLYRYRWISQPVVNQSGQVAYVEQTIDRLKNEYNTQIRGIGLDGSQDAALTEGVKDSAPSWSPDGAKLAFLRAGDGGGKGLWVLTPGEEQPTELLSADHKILSYVWSPDGRSIAFTSKALRNQEESTEEKSGEPSPLRGRVFERTTPKAEGSGWWDGLYSHLFIYELASGTVTQLTSGEFNVSSPVWSPDSQSLSYMSKQVDDHELDPDLMYFTDVFTIRIADRVPFKVTTSDLLVSQFSYTPDGQQIVLIASDREYGSGSHNRLYEVSPSGGTVKPISSHLDMQFGNAALGDMKSAAASPAPLFEQNDPAGNAMYVLGTHGGSVDVYRISGDGECQSITGTGDRDVYQYTLSPDGKTLIYAALTEDCPGELYCVSIDDDGQAYRLTYRNDEVMSELEVHTPERIEFTSSDGWPVQGWIIRPEKGNASVRTNTPLILQIHGGPHAMYTGTFSHEIQSLAAQGYAVLWVNPRGSMGYGQAFARACRGDFAGGDYRDLMEAVDYALATYDELDESRLGVGGGSYGGVMTNWIVAHNHRFKAAVTQRCISNWLSMYGTSDIGISYVEGVIGGNPAHNAEWLWSRSPLAYAHQIETPLLIMHGEQDYRTPIAQAEELYTTLKRYGKTTKLIRYPGSNHSLLKIGKPSLRVDSFEQVNRWFNQYLQEAGEEA